MQLSRCCLVQAAKEALASLPLSIFAAHKEENKHGFHSGHVAIGKARKELDEVLVPVAHFCRLYPGTASSQ